MKFLKRLSANRIFSHQINKLETFKIFSRELELIKNKHIRTLVIKILQQAPNYFWEISSSEKGKYHPKDEHNKRGLVLHTKRTIYLAKQLCEIFDIKRIERDKLIGAMLIHDICARGIDEKPLDYTLLEHPFLIKKLTKNLKNHKYYNEIISIVEAHLGRWTPKRYKIKKSKLAKLGHIADYIASRKEVNIKI